MPTVARIIVEKGSMCPQWPVALQVPFRDHSQLDPEPTLEIEKIEKIEKIENSNHCRKGVYVPTAARIIVEKGSMCPQWPESL